MTDSQGVLTREDGAKLAFRRVDGEGPTVVWLGGFHSDMTGTKAEVLAEQAEGLDKRLALADPAVETDARLAGRLGGLHHLDVGQAQLLVEAADGGDGRLAHPDRTDLGALDESDLEGAALEVPAQRGRRHPAGGAPADDHQLPDPVVRHRTLRNRSSGPGLEPG